MKTPTFASANLLDLNEFVEATSGPYLSVILPARSDVPDAVHRLDDAWRRIQNDVSGRWPEAALAKAEQAVLAAGHARGDSMAMILPTEGAPLVEHLAGSPASTRIMEGPLPAFTPIIEHRQRTIPHLVVECDKAGADIMAFDGGNPLVADRVDGDEHHIHRGHPGGWSQRRFQQRAENTWDSNISDIADAVEQLAARVEAQLIAVAGPTRAQSMLVSELEKRSLGDVTKALEAGDVDGIADEVVRLTNDVHARAIAAISENFSERCAHDTATVEQSQVLDALAAGRVESLLVVDDWSDTAQLGRPFEMLSRNTRIIDAAISAAMTSGATVTIVPGLAALEDPIGAFLRW
ncbi:Vms1/Ankzf1 family peptidyl-tRNA hydrolase [Ilumatobacter sp.]|uniref:baeRF2 domain-containing protein n=1 Tax=Ilumatobacter sp. TaxID=1967498 RepID=UPI00375103B3